MLKLKEDLVNLNEYRIEVKDNSDIIMRDESEKNVVFTSILFAKTEFLENIKNYYEGESFVYFSKNRKIRNKKINERNKFIRQ